MGEVGEATIYPLRLLHGTYAVVADDAQDTWENVVPVINDDQTISMTRNGEIIGHIRYYDHIGRSQ